jgi:hypothetical protein
MAARGRPAKVLTQTEIQALKVFLQHLPFLKKNQQTVLKLIQESKDVFDDKQLSLLKIVDREKNQFQQRQALIEQINIKHKNQQKLLANEIEILELLDQEQDRDTFFRLDRALESYQKIEKAALDNRIRLENEHKREILNKTHKELTESQKKRNTENQLKYALGGMLLSIWKKFKLPLDPENLEKIESRISRSILLESKIRNTALYKEAYNLTGNHTEARKLMLISIEFLPTYNIQNEELHKVLVKKLHKPK